MVFYNIYLPKIFRYHVHALSLSLFSLLLTYSEEQSKRFMEKLLAGRVTTIEIFRELKLHGDAAGTEADRQGRPETREGSRDGERKRRDDEVVVYALYPMHENFGSP